MRILLYRGKGGVGKTSVAAATGLRLAGRGKRTLIMSVDPAHSLADAFDLETGLFHARTSDPLPIQPRRSIPEVNIQKEIRRHWRRIATYITSVLRTSGLNDLEAEEMAIFPGMKELSAMMYLNQFRKEDRYDVIVLASSSKDSGPSSISASPVARRPMVARPLARRLIPDIGSSESLVYGAQEQGEAGPHDERVRPGFAQAARPSRCRNAPSRAGKRKR